MPFRCLVVRLTWTGNPSFGFACQEAARLQVLGATGIVQWCIETLVER